MRSYRDCSMIHCISAVLPGFLYVSCNISTKGRTDIHHRSKSFLFPVYIGKCLVWYYIRISFLIFITYPIRLTSSTFLIGIRIYPFTIQWTWIYELGGRFFTFFTVVGFLPFYMKNSQLMLFHKIHRPLFKEMSMR